MKPIYIPTGKAKEYGDYALNIYTGCPHKCFYCFAPTVLRTDRKAFHGNCQPRKNIVEATAKQIEHDEITGKLVHLCFTCDPYPTGCDSAETRKIIKLLKDSGNSVQILTKGDGSRDFDLLDNNDWYGITITGAVHDTQEPGTIREPERIKIMNNAPCHKWVSFEPVLQPDFVLAMLNSMSKSVRVKIGKLNYWPSKTNWHEFGIEAEKICKKRGLDYYIKTSLRNEMQEATP